MAARCRNAALNRPGVSGGFGLCPYPVGTRRVLAACVSKPAREVSNQSVSWPATCRLMESPDLLWPMDNKQHVREVMDAMSQGRLAPLLEAMAENVTWRWMGVNQWSRSFEGKKSIVDHLFGGATEILAPSSSTEVHRLHADGDYVVIEHSGRNELSDGRRYDNNYCWIFRLQDGLIQEVREYMDTQLVTDTFGPDLAT